MWQIRNKRNRKGYEQKGIVSCYDVIDIVDDGVIRVWQDDTRHGDGARAVFGPRCPCKADGTHVVSRCRCRRG